MCRLFTPRRSVLIACVLLSLAACSPKNDPAGSGDAPDTVAMPAEVEGPVNVVWILLDACRADHLSAYGYHRPTSPNIDALAARGTLFKKNYAQGPNTLLSVGSYMTGRHFPAYYQDARHLSWWFLQKPAEDEKLISTIFRENGYATVMFSASPWYSPDSRLAKGFGEFYNLHYGKDLPESDFATRNPYVFDWLETHATEPFFLYLHSLDTHEPRWHNNTETTWLDSDFPADRDKELREWKHGPFTPEDQQHLVDLYDGGVAYADQSVGEIVAALERLGVLDKTIILITADHGEALAQDGETLGHPGDLSADDVLITPLIVAGPGVPKGQRIAFHTENADIAPTLVDLAGLTTNAAFDGVSLRSTITQSTPKPPHDYAFARTTAFMINTEPNSILVYDDVKFDFSGLTADGYKFLGLPERPMEIAWAMPDAVGARRPAQVPADRMDKIRAEVKGPIHSAWEHFHKQPVEIPPYFEKLQGGSLNPDAITTERDDTDNRWTRSLSGYLFHRSTGDLLVCDPATETPPGIISGLIVPNGTYKVSLYTTTEPVEGEPRGVSFKFLKYPEETAYREFGLPAPEPGKVNSAWIDVGTYTVTEETFNYWLEPGRPEDLTVVGAFRFTVEGAEHALPDEQALEEERERLRSTGYLQD